MYDCKHWWSGDFDINLRSSFEENFGATLCCFRAVFNLALLAISAVAVRSHHNQEYPLANDLAKCLVGLSAFALFLDISQIAIWANPVDSPPIPVLLNFLLASGRFSIIVVGLVPRNNLRHIYVQYRRDDRGGVIIGLNVVLWVTEVLYCLLGMGILWQILIFPCWLVCGLPWKGLRNRARKDREYEDKGTTVPKQKISRSNSTGGY